jgi:hypothetical protein
MDNNNSDTLTTLTKRIQKLGCSLRRKEVEQHYNRFYDSNSAVTSSIASLQPSQHLVLTQRFNIPLSLPALKDILRSIVNIASTIPELLELDKHGGSKQQATSQRLMAIVPSRNEDRLYRNARRWIPKIIDSSVDDDAELSRYHVVSTLIKVLSQIDKQALVDTSKSVTGATKPIRMDPMLQKALIYDAHISQSQFKLIRKYCIVSLGFNPFQPEQQVRALDVGIFKPTIVPFTDSHRKRMAHYRPVDQVFKWKLDRALSSEDAHLKLNSTMDLTNIVECHVVVGGDHGQGAFRFVATVLLFSKEGSLIANGLDICFEEDFLCGFIHCKKDKYQVLNSTIAKPLNELLQRIAKGKELVFLKDKSNGYFIEWGAANAAAKVAEGASSVHSAPIQLFMVGDLAFQLMAQGREGYASYWCPRCQWGWSNWQCYTCSNDAEDASARVRLPWTWNAMQQQRDNCSGKSVKPQEKRGLECKPLFDAIPVKNYLAPVLHSVDLFINTAKDLLDAFIDHRIEDRPQELLEARWLEAEMKIAERQALEEFDDTKAIVEEVTTSGADEDLIQKSKAVQALAEEAHKAAKKAYGKAAAAARKLEKSKSYGAMTQAIRQEVDGLLADTFHILRSSYHGGDMEGNHCRRLVRLADKAMEAI